MKLIYRVWVTAVIAFVFVPSSGNLRLFQQNRLFAAEPENLALLFYGGCDPYEFAPPYLQTLVAEAQGLKRAGWKLQVLFGDAKRVSYARDVIQKTGIPENQLRFGTFDEFIHALDNAATLPLSSQFLVSIHTHGFAQTENQPHRICFADGLYAFDHPRVLAALQKLKERGVQLLIEDNSCFSGASLQTLKSYGCVIASSSPNWVTVLAGVSTGDRTDKPFGLLTLGGQLLGSGDRLNQMDFIRTDGSLGADQTLSASELIAGRSLSATNSYFVSDMDFRAVEMINGVRSLRWNTDDYWIWSGWLDVTDPFPYVNQINFHQTMDWLQVAQKAAIDPRVARLGQQLGFASPPELELQADKMLPILQKALELIQRQQQLLSSLNSRSERVCIQFDPNLQTTQQVFLESLLIQKPEDRQRSLYFKNTERLERSQVQAICFDRQILSGLMRKYSDYLRLGEALDKNVKIAICYNLLNPQTEKAAQLCTSTNMDLLLPVLARTEEAAYKQRLVLDPETESQVQEAIGLDLKLKSIEQNGRMSELKNLFDQYRGYAYLHQKLNSSEPSVCDRFVVSGIK